MTASELARIIAYRTAYFGVSDTIKRVVPLLEKWQQEQQAKIERLKYARDHLKGDMAALETLIGHKEAEVKRLRAIVDQAIKCRDEWRRDDSLDGDYEAVQVELFQMLNAETGDT